MSIIIDGTLRDVMQKAQYIYLSRNLFRNHHRELNVNALDTRIQYIEQHLEYVRDNVRALYSEVHPQVEALMEEIDATHSH